MTCKASLLRPIAIRLHEDYCPPRFGHLCILGFFSPAAPFIMLPPASNSDEFDQVFGNERKGRADLGKRKGKERRVG